jgi:hypothetical protein
MKNDAEGVGYEPRTRSTVLSVRLRLLKSNVSLSAPIDIVAVLLIGVQRFLRLIYPHIIENNW